jgi:hypothetical protein
MTATTIADLTLTASARPDGGCGQSAEQLPEAGGILDIGRDPRDGVGQEQHRAVGAADEVLYR